MIPIHFAPLQGYTEAPYRCVHQQICGGIDTYYTPFIRLEHGQIRKKDLREALPEHNVGILIVPQVIACDDIEFKILVEKLISLGHKEIDVNMGCPFPLQTRVGRGSGILTHPDKVKAILSQLTKIHDTQGTTFSIKMRLGQESAEEAISLLPYFNAAPLRHITLHPRIGKNQYKGELDMESFAKFYEHCEIPLIFNGMLSSTEEIVAIEEKYTRLAGIMIGRGLLSRPTLAWEYANGKTLEENEVKLKVLQMHRLLLNHYESAIEGGENQLVLKMHSFWEYLEPIFGHKSIKKILKSGSLRNYREAVANV